MAKVAILGNSKYVDEELLIESLDAAQWSDKITTVVTTDANKHLMRVVQSLCHQMGYTFFLIECPWRVTNAKGEEIQNNQAVFNAYERIPGKVNAIMAFTTNEEQLDKAVAQIEKDAAKMQIPCIVYNVEPPPKPVSIDKLPALSSEDRLKLQKFRDEHFDPEVATATQEQLDS